jgi:DNA-binding response OmpR family regulator
MRILIVEDDFAGRKVLQRLLKEYGDCDVAVDGVEAVAAIDLARSAGQPYDVMFLDIMMPRMNGYEVCEAVTRDPDLSGVRIILLTAKGQETDRRQGLESGAGQYMTKPFDPDEVVAVARRALALPV